MVIVVVLLFLLAALAPLMAGQVTDDTSLLALSTNKHAALAAAEAAIQWYRDNLDSYPNYYQYSAAFNPINDAALSGYCGAGQSKTCGLAGTTPPESFHYSPSTTSLSSQTASGVPTVVLTVTGRGGSKGHYAYIYAQETFSVSSILNNAYYSSYEILDPSSQTIQGISVTTSSSGGPTTSTPETGYFISSYNGSGGTVPVSPSENVWQLTCQYDTYSINTFVDSLGLTIGGKTYSAAYPYYGPYFENSGFNFTVPGPGVKTTTVTVPGLPCESPYDFVSGETFNGPVYTNDQLHICGTPQFNGSPVSLTSGAPSNVPYLPKGRQVPGSVLVTAANSGANGPYPSSLIGYYMPVGYTVDTVNGSASCDTPNFAQGVALNGAQSLPATNGALQQYGTNSPPAPALGSGCTYVGPTMIELVTSGSTTTMDVWSPLSSVLAGTTSACSNGLTFSAASPFITGISMPSDGVVYVENYVPGTMAPVEPCDGSNPNYTPQPWPNPADCSNVSGPNQCFNPYQSAQPPNSAACLEGDVYIEGELYGQLTVASQANIMVTRNVTYACADGSTGASQTNPSSVTTCKTETTPDILGLSAAQDILISGNTGSAGNTNCSSNGFGTGFGSPTNTGTSINGTAYPNDPKAVWPTVCNPDNIIIDAAALGVKGSFGVENWSTTPQSGGAYLNGTDLSMFRGPFGITGSPGHGYSKQFSFDQRLAYLSSPYLLPAGVQLWQDVNYVLCPNATTCPLIG